MKKILTITISESGSDCLSSMFDASTLFLDSSFKNRQEKRYYYKSECTSSTFNLINHRLLTETFDVVRFIITDEVSDFYNHVGHWLKILKSLDHAVLAHSHFVFPGKIYKAGVIHRNLMSERKNEIENPKNMPKTFVDFKIIRSISIFPIEENPDEEGPYYQRKYPNKGMELHYHGTEK